MTTPSKPSPTLTPEAQRWRDRGEHFIRLAQKLFREHTGVDREARLGLALQKIEYRAYEGGYNIGRREALKQTKLVVVVSLVVGFAVGFLVA